MARVGAVLRRASGGPADRLVVFEVLSGTAPARGELR